MQETGEKKFAVLGIESFKKESFKKEAFERRVLVKCDLRQAEEMMVHVASGTKERSVCYGRYCSGKQYFEQTFAACKAAGYQSSSCIYLVADVHSERLMKDQVIMMLKNYHKDGPPFTLALEYGRKYSKANHRSIFSHLAKRWPRSGFDRLGQYLLYESQSTEVVSIDDHGLCMTPADHAASMNPRSQYIVYRFLASYHHASRILSIAKKNHVIALIGMAHLFPILDFFKQLPGLNTNRVVLVSPPLKIPSQFLQINYRSRTSPLSFEDANYQYKKAKFKDRYKGTFMLIKGFMEALPWHCVRRASPVLFLILQRLLLPDEGKPIIALICAYLVPKLPSRQFLESLFDLLHKDNRESQVRAKIKLNAFFQIAVDSEVFVMVEKTIGGDVLKDKKSAVTDCIRGLEQYKSSVFDKANAVRA